MAKKETTPDRIQLYVVIDGTPARKQLAELTQDAVKLKQQQKALREEEKLLLEQRKAAAKVNDTKEVERLTGQLANVRRAYGDVTAAIKTNGTAQDELRAGMGVLDLSLTELRKKAQALRAAWSAGVGSKEALLETARELQLVELRIQALGTAQGRALALWEEERKTIDRNKWSLEQLRLEQQRAQIAFETAEGDSDARKQAAADLDRVTAEIKAQSTEAGRNARAWEEMRKTMRLEQMSIDHLKQEKAYLEQLINTSKRTGDQFNQLERELLEVDRALKASTSETARNERAWEQERRGLKLTELSMEQLAKEIEHLNRVKSRINPERDAAQFQVYSKALKDAEQRQRLLTTGMGPFARMWQEAKVQAMSAGVVIGGLFTGTALIQGARNMIRSSAELSDQISDVRKTTGLSTPVVKELVRELGRIDTRTSRKELLELARDAGKLGISAKEDVLAFVRAGNQINVALGEDLGQDAIKNIGKLVDLFKLKERFGLETSMLKVGSAINDLGMASTASEGYMVDFLKRMGGIAPLAGITIEQTLALGATLDSLGQTSEVSSTALSKLFVKLGTDAEKYAGIAGMSVEKFKEVLGKNALEAFIAVLDGSKRTEGGVVALSETLGEMGIDAARAAGVFGVLSQNTDTLRKFIDQATRSFSEGSSVTEEYTEKNNNLAAQLDKLGKEFKGMIGNTTLIDFFTSLVGVSRDVVAWMQRNTAALTFMAKVLGTAGAAWVSYRLIGAAWLRIAALQTTATLVLSNAQNLFSTNTITAGRAYIFFSNALKTSIPGLIAGAITALAAAFAGFGKELSAAALNVARETTALQTLYLQITATNRGTEERTKLIEQLKAQYPEYLSQIKADTVSNEDLGKAVAFVNDQLINKAVLARADEQIEEQNAKSAELRMDRLAKERELREALVEASRTTGIAIPQKAGADLQETVNAFLELVRQSEAFNYQTAKTSVLFEALKDLAIAETYSLSDGNKLLEVRNRLMRELGIWSASASGAMQDQARAMGDVEKEITSIEAALANPRTKENVDVGILENRLEALYKQRDALKKVTEDTVRTVEWYNAQIKNLQEQQQQTTDPRSFQKLEAEIKRLEKLRDRITGGDDKGRKKQEKAAEDLEKLLAEYKQFESELLADSKDSDARELEQLRLKHAQELTEVQEQQRKLIAAKKLSETDAAIDLDILKGNQGQEEIDLLEQQGEKRMKVFRERNAKIKEALDEFRNQDLEADVEYYTEQVRMAQEAGTDARALIRQRHEAELLLYAENARDLIAQETDKYDELIALAKQRLEEFDAALSSSGIDPNDAVLAERQALVDGVIALEQAQADAVGNIRRKQRAADTAAARAATRELRQEYTKRLQDFALIASAVGDMVSSINQYQDAGIAAAEARADADGERTEQELAEIERLKEARRQAALVAIAVQGAAAIASGVASAMSLQPWPAAVAAALSTVGIVVGLMAQARALMNEANTSQGTNSNGAARGTLNNVPVGADGLAMREGVVNLPDRPINSSVGGGVLGGQHHRDGGNDVIDRKTGRVLANVEKGEGILVMSRRATVANADLLPALLKASREGTRITPFDRPLATPAPATVGQALRVVHMAQGGLLGDIEIPTKKQRNPLQEAGADLTQTLRTMLDQESNGKVVQLLEQLLAQNTRLIDGVERFPTELRATTSIVDHERRKVEYDKILDLSRARKRA